MNQQQQARNNKRATPNEPTTQQQTPATTVTQHQTLPATNEQQQAEGKHHLIVLTQLGVSSHLPSARKLRLNSLGFRSDLLAARRPVAAPKSTSSSTSTASGALRAQGDDDNRCDAIILRSGTGVDIDDASQDRREKLLSWSCDGVPIGAMCLDAASVVVAQRRRSGYARGSC